jgi:tetratricopeptide (TPR) repeat protein/TolB-like protein
MPFLRLASQPFAAHNGCRFQNISRSPEEPFSMVCPHCGTVTTAVAGRCASCNGLVNPTGGPQVAAGLLTPPPPGQAPSDDVTRLATSSGSLGPLSQPPPASAIPVGASPARRTGLPSTQRTGLTGFGGAAVGPLAPGQTFGTRYHIIRLLGAGGMGAVYQAWDDELGVAVAIKTIRPEVTSDPTQAADLERRFKRELLLARQVTHKNVVRIHDLGEIDGIKYITMPYIQGQDLASVLKSIGKVPVSAALRLARQIAAGLQAAHEAGVVHRDLKPANIMVEEEHATIMDFGIARSASGGGGTVLGAVVGTLEYMAPEQARAEPVDHRADLYAFGLIFYDMLLGRRHAGRPESAVAELMERMQHAPPSPRTVDPLVPETIDRIVNRCLQPDAAARYQTTAELVADLEALDADGHPLAGRTISGGPPIAGVAVWRRVAWWQWAAAAVVLLMVGLGGFLLRDRARGAAESTIAAGPTVSLAILPFRNASGDATLDWLGPSLAEMVRTEVGQSARFRTVPTERVLQILRDMRVAADSTFNPADLKRLAEFGSADAVLWGQYVKFGNEIRIDATLQDVKRQQDVPLRVVASNQGMLMDAIGQLATSARDKLALPSDIVNELKGKSRRPSTGSFQALRYYNEGLQLARHGKHSDAVKSFEAATRDDPDFALAYSRMGQEYATLGYDDNAEQFSRRAVDLGGALPAAERYLILANHAQILNDTKKAVEAYENLLKAAPDDSQVQFDLAKLYEDTAAYDSARDLYGRVLQRDPNYVDALIAMGRVQIRRGDPQGALDYLNRALSLAIQLENDEARATTLHAIGVSYKRLNKLADALRYYRESLDIKRRIGSKGGAAASLNEIAQVQNRLGQIDAALASYGAAMELQREIGDKNGLGSALINLGVLYEGRGEYDRALNLYRESLQIQREVNNEKSQALCLNNIGNIYLFKGQYDDALTYFERALQLRDKLKVPSDTALTLHNLAETRTKLGQYGQALADYFRSIELYRSAGDQRWAAIESYSMGTLFGYQGRYGAAAKAKEEALTTFRQLGDRSFWMAEILSGYGNALSQLGRTEEAQKSFEEALTLARELKNQALVAQTLNFQGDSFFYRGDFDAARRLFDEALKGALPTKDRHLILLSRANLAKVAVKERPQTAAKIQTQLAREADALGLKYLSVDCSIHLVEALLAARQPVQASREGERVLAASEKAGLQALLAKSHYLLAKASEATGDSSNASRHYAEARRILEEIRKEAGTDAVIKRTDLRPIYADSASLSETSRK